MNQASADEFAQVIDYAFRQALTDKWLAQLVEAALLERPVMRRGCLCRRLKLSAVEVARRLWRRTSYKSGHDSVAESLRVRDCCG